MLRIYMGVGGDFGGVEERLDNVDGDYKEVLYC